MIESQAIADIQKMEDERFLAIVEQVAIPLSWGAFGVFFVKGQ